MEYLHAQVFFFNHRVPSKGRNFCNKENSEGIGGNKIREKKRLSLGNLDAKRDWGHAKDYVDAMWRIMQYKKPDDFVVATGKQVTIREFVIKCLRFFNFKFKFSGKGLNEKILNHKNQIIVDVDKKYFRPIDVENLKGDSSKARKLLGWQPSYTP